MEHTKKMAAGGGLRKGKARFGDDVRERARKAIAENLAKAENKSKFGGKEPVATAKKVSPPKTVKAKPIPKKETKPETKSETKSETKPKTKPKTKSETKPYQFGPAMTFSKGVGTDAAAKARKESMEKQGPFGDLMDLIRGKKKAMGGTVKMSRGGSASKRADGCATKGKTRGRVV